MTKLHQILQPTPSKFAWKTRDRTNQISLHNSQSAKFQNKGVVLTRYLHLPSKYDGKRTRIDRDIANGAKPLFHNAKFSRNLQLIENHQKNQLAQSK